jgi:peptide deformylase
LTQQAARIDRRICTAYIATMAVREILKLPDKRLRLVSAPVNRIDAGLRALVEDMFDTMYAAPGIGLAGIQIGVAKRVVTMDLSKKEEAHEPLGLSIPKSCGVRRKNPRTRKAACRFPNSTKRSSGRVR